MQVITAFRFEGCVMASQERSTDSIGRRDFMVTSAVATTIPTVVIAAPNAVSRSAAEKIVVGVMGLSRGLSLAKTFAALPNVEVRYLCETDSRRLSAAQTDRKSVV